MQNLQNMNELIKTGARSIYGTNHVLARAWRNLVVDSQVSTEQWSRLTTQWIDSRLHKRSDKDSTSTKGNYTKMLAKKSLTWNGFMTGLSILQYEKMEIHIKLFKKGKSRELELVVDIENVLNENDGLE